MKYDSGHLSFCDKTSLCDDVITLILPTYNEKDNIENIVKSILETKAKINIIIIDDDSPDGTGTAADKLAKSHASVSVIHRKGERGLGSAIKCGFREKSDVYGVMDADQSHDPSIIPSMIKEIENGTDFVIGSRYVKGGGIANWPFYRKIVSRAATLIARPLTGVKDPLSGYFFVRKNVVESMKINPESCKICLDILVRGSYRKVVEVPYVFKNRSSGQTKILNSKEIFRYMKYVLYLYCYSISKCFK